MERDKDIKVFVNDDEKRRIRIAAAEMDMSMSSFLLQKFFEWEARKDAETD